MGSQSPMLSGRVAIVTGAARGIGRGIALAFAQEGASVRLDDRDAEAWEQAPAAGAAIGTQCRDTVADVSDEESVQGFVAATIETLGGLHILVNNAGVSSTADVVDLS